MLSHVGRRCASGTIGCNDTSGQAFRAILAPRKVVTVVLADGDNILGTLELPAVLEEVTDLPRVLGDVGCTICLIPSPVVGL